MFKFIDVNQNTDEWFQMRCGKLTSSKLGTIMANHGKAFGDPAKKYAVNIAIEQITGNPIASTFTNDHMQRGHDQEPLARILYENEMFCEVTNGGFWESDFIGCSPDGMVDDNGAIEIKSVIAPVHYANVKRGKVDPAYRWQCIGNLKFTSSDYLDFISYCEEFPEGMRLFTYRLNKDDLTDEFEMLNERIEQFKTLVNDTREQILTSSYFNNNG